MILLDATVTTVQDKDIIWGLWAIIVAFLAFGSTAFWVFYNGMMKRFDRIERKLEPVEIKVAIHDTEILNIKNDFTELNKWVGNHDGRIQSLERKVITNH